MSATGLLVLVATLCAASAVGLLLRTRAGRVRAAAGARLGVLRTPTTVAFDQDGAELVRVCGVPRRGAAGLGRSGTGGGVAVTREASVSGSWDGAAIDGAFRLPSRP